MTCLDMELEYKQKLDLAGVDCELDQVLDLGYQVSYTNDYTHIY